RTAFPRKLDLDDVPTLGPQELEVVRLVQVPLLRDELCKSLSRIRPLPLLECHLKRQRRQVRTREVGRQVRRRKVEPSLEPTHRYSIVARPPKTYARPTSSLAASSVEPEGLQPRGADIAEEDGVDRL